MASFSIPDIPPKTDLTPGTVDTSSGKALSPHTGTVQFAVNNSTGEIREGRLSVRGEGEAKPEWFTIDGEAQRDFGTASSETVKVGISVPAEAKAGEYSFRLLVAEVNDPDNDYEISQSTAFTVPPAEKVGGTVKKSKWWLWVLIGLVVLAIIGGVVWAITRKKDPPVEQPKVESTTAAVPDLIGKTLSEARGLSEDFDLTPVAGTAEGKEPDTILTQTPVAGLTERRGNPLKVTFDPGVEIPSLSNQTTAQAINTLNRVGLHVQASTTKCIETGTAGMVVGQNPRPSTRIAKGKGIEITVTVLPNSRLGCNVRIIDIQRIEAIPVIKTSPIAIPKDAATFRPQIVQ